MCMQDIRIGRNSTFRQSSNPVALTAGQVVEANASRIGLVLQNIGANPILVSFDPSLAPASGLLLGVGDDPQEFYLGHGQGQVLGPVAAISTGGASTLALIETFLPGEP